MVQPTAYSRFTPDELSLLGAPGNEEIQDAWLSALELLDSLVGSFSESHPLPLYFREEQDAALLETAIENLKGTRFYKRMKQNAGAAGEIRKMWERHGHTDELHAAADAYLDELDLDYVAVARPREEGQPRAPARPVKDFEPRRRMAGGR